MSNGRLEVGFKMKQGNPWKLFVKKLSLYLAAIIAGPFIIMVYLGRKAGLDDVFNTWGTALSLIPGKIGSYIRVSYYLFTLEEMSREVFIGFGSYFAHQTARVGRNVTIGGHCILGTVTIENDVLIGSRVSIPSGKYQHGGLNVRANELGEIKYERICIGERAWIGEGAIIMANIGKDAIVASGSVVTRPIPDNMIAMGNPARPVIRRKEDEIQMGDRSAANLPQGCRVKDR